MYKSYNVVNFKNIFFLRVGFLENEGVRKREDLVKCSLAII